MDGMEVVDVFLLDVIENVYVFPLYFSYDFFACLTTRALVAEKSVRLNVFHILIYVSFSSILMDTKP